MFISKIVFNEASAFKEVFAGGYALHQAVWDLFSDKPDRKRDFLYRLDCSGRMPLVYAVSSRTPSDAKRLWCIESKEYMPKIEIGTKLGFTVRVNPTIKRDGKRHDVVMDAKYKARAGNNSKEAGMQELIAFSCREWFEKRSHENGFKVLQFMADSYQQVQLSKAKVGVPVRYSTVDLTGVIEITDQKLFIDTLFNGLGPEKSFGCGLMLICKL